MPRHVRIILTLVVLTIFTIYLHYLRRERASVTSEQAAPAPASMGNPGVFLEGVAQYPATYEPDSLPEQKEEHRRSLVTETS